LGEVQSEYDRERCPPYIGYIRLEKLFSYDGLDKKRGVVA